MGEVLATGSRNGQALRKRKHRICFSVDEVAIIAAEADRLELPIAVVCRRRLLARNETFMCVYEQKDGSG